MARSIRYGSLERISYAAPRRRSKRRHRTYWAEIGFIAMAVLFLRPELLQNALQALQEPPAVTATAD